MRPQACGAPPAFLRYDGAVFLMRACKADERSSTAAVDDNLASGMLILGADGVMMGPDGPMRPQDLLSPTTSPRALGRSSGPSLHSQSGTESAQSSNAINTVAMIGANEGAREREAQEGAAVKIQAVARGKAERKELHARAEEEAREREAQEGAAVKIQAVARGKAERKELHARAEEEAREWIPQFQTSCALPIELQGSRVDGDKVRDAFAKESSPASAPSVPSDRAVSPIDWTGDEAASSAGLASTIADVHQQRVNAHQHKVDSTSSTTRSDPSNADGLALLRKSSSMSSAGMSSASSTGLARDTDRVMILGGRRPSGGSTREGVSEDCAAEHAFLQKVVKQLESDDPQEATSAAAALEYLVSSSDPKREGGREGLLSCVQWSWSAEGAKANRRALGMFPGLWRNLLGLLMNSNPATQAQVCGAMSKLGFRNTKNVLEMIKYPKMLMALTDLLDMDKHPQTVVVQAWRVLQNFVSGMEEIKVVLCSTDHLVMRIKEACTRVGVAAEVRMRAVSVIMHASSSDEARLLLVKAKVAEEALQAVMSADINTEKDEATRIRATLASANLCGREERSILSTAPEMLRAIGETIVHAFHGTEYHHIKWSLAGVMLPLFNLSCSDSNKKVLSQCGTVVLLLQAVSEGAKVLLGRLGSENADKVEDRGDWSSETLEMILRTLANFTFDADAKEQMLKADALVILTDVLASLKAQRDSSDSSGGAPLWVSAILITKDILYMLSEKNEDMITEVRLQARGVDDDSVKHDDEAKPDGKQQHIMISYSWAQGKDFVVEVGAGLRNRGFDVWRDEEGSQLVRKMMGSSMEIMAQAIEYADVVVIFVSRAYRDSYNCKLEGKYAQVRERAGLTKILFVMMEEDYTPEANGGVDGWLGMLIGDHIYYPGWDPDKLDETVSELSRAIHKMRHDAQAPMAIELSKTSGPMAPERPPLTPSLGGSGSHAALTLGARRNHSSASSDDGIVLGRRENWGPYLRPRRGISAPFPADDLMGDDSDNFDQESGVEVSPPPPFCAVLCSSVDWLSTWLQVWVLGATKIMLTMLFWQGMLTPKTCPESVHAHSTGPSQRSAMGELVASRKGSFRRLGAYASPGSTGKLSRVDEGMRSSYLQHMSGDNGDSSLGAGVDKDTPEPPAGAGAKIGQTPSSESNDDISHMSPVGSLFSLRKYYVAQS